MTAATVYASCAHCGARMATNHDRNGRPRLYCGDVCRQRACRARHKTIAATSSTATLDPSRHPAYGLDAPHQREPAEPRTAHGGLTIGHPSRRRDPLSAR